MNKKIITLGPEFSYSYNVAHKYYTKKINIQLIDTIDAVFENINKNTNGIIPIENMLNGSVRETFFKLQEGGIYIVRAFDYSVDHVLASQHNKFNIIMSHVQALVQCSKYLDKFRSKGVEIIETTSTSQAMSVAASNANIAAIGSLEATKFYNLNIIKNKISNKQNNITRFIEVSKNKKQINGKKTSIIIKPQFDRSGLLFEILSIFKIKNINLTKIESIPTGFKMNDYIFYLDLDGCGKDKNMVEAFDFLNTFVDVIILGSYNIDK